MKIAALLVVFAPLLAPLQAHAEYRVYQLQITNQQGQSRVVLSNLDDIQYRGYYPVKSTDQIIIQDTWMCWQRSDRSQDPEQRYCPNPRAPLQKQLPPTI